MQVHELKADPDVFDDVAAGLKTFEIRYDDRGYKVGDQVILKKTRYSGDEMKQGKPLEYLADYVATVSHILRGPCYGLADGWVIMSLERKREAEEMTKDELIARQAQNIEELKEENASLSERIETAVRHIVCIGGPLNDNMRRYNAEQLREWQRVLDALD